MDTKAPRIFIFIPSLKYILGAFKFPNHAAPVDVWGSKTKRNYQDWSNIQGEYGKYPRLTTQCHETVPVSLCMAVSNEAASQSQHDIACDGRPVSDKSSVRHCEQFWIRTYCILACIRAKHFQPHQDESGSRRYSKLKMTSGANGDARCPELRVYAQGYSISQTVLPYLAFNYASYMYRYIKQVMV